ncbi:MAG: SirA family protein [Proteobacteria bacterium]|nr:MAG: SirA family protein [Pseudomonadota bacterium]
MSEFNQELDVTGLNCPLPILRCKKAMNAMDTGETINVIATDPGAVRDFEAYCKQTGHELMNSSEEDGKFIFLIRKN